MKVVAGLAASASTMVAAAAAYQLGSQGGGLWGVGMVVAAIGAGIAIGLLLTARVARPYDPETLLAALAAELDRARRRPHPVSLLHLALKPNRSAWTGLEQALRSTEVVQIADGAALIVMPAAPRSEAEALVARLQRECPTAVGEEYRIATFPDDGVTEHALIAAVSGQPIFHEPLGKVALVNARDQAPDGSAVGQEERVG